MLCREASLVAVDRNQIWLHTLKCRCWKCELCRDELRRRVMRLAADGEPLKVLTLTVNPAHEPDPDLAADELMDAWQFLWRRLRKKFDPKRLAYFSVWEKTKRGYPHLHILLRAPFVPVRQISRIMEERIDAPIVDIRSIRGRRAAVNYVAKYLAKDNHKWPGHDRYGYSRNWLHTDTARSRQPLPKPNAPYRLIKAHPSQFMRYSSYYWTWTTCGDTAHGWRHPPPSKADKPIDWILQHYGLPAMTGATR